MRNFQYEKNAQKNKSYPIDVKLFMERYFLLQSMMIVVFFKVVGIFVNLRNLLRVKSITFACRQNL